MKSKTVKELRALAKARGIKGYSKLTKEALVRQLETSAGETLADSARTTSLNATRHGTAGAAPETRAKIPSPAASEERVPVVERPAVATEFESTEQLVEDAKYALRPQGGPWTPPPADLDEDIERLPELTEPVVALLPQKPGILHAYWVLPPGEVAQRGGYALRLCRTEGETLEVGEEVPVRAERGTWYFHLAHDGAETGGLLVQLGYYEAGRFRSAGGRSIARLPSPYASSRTDQRWWIDEADFLRMYLRGGGFVTPARRFGWAASIGSPAAPGVRPEERLAWPGGVGSPAK